MAESIWVRLLELAAARGTAWQLQEQSRLAF
jgi:hypothetical protein